MARVWRCCFVFCDEAYGDHWATSDSKLLVREFDRFGHVLDIVYWRDTTVRWSDYDLVLPLAPFDYPLHIDEFVKWLQMLDTAGVNMLNPPAVLRWSMDKHYLLQLQSAGIPIADTTVYEKRNSNFPSLDDAFKRKKWTDVIIKPAIGGDSIGVMRVTQGVKMTEAQRHFEELLKGGDVLLQEYIAAFSNPGETCCVFICGRFSHAVLKTPKKAIDISKGIDIRKVTPTEDLRSAAERAIEAAKLLIPERGDLLYARVDLCEDPARNMIILNELELLEPSLFLELEDSAAKILTEGVIDALMKCIPAQVTLPE